MDNTIARHSAKTHEGTSSDVELRYLPQSDKMLLVNESSLKLVMREEGNFPLNDTLSFTESYPSSHFSDVRVDLNLSDIKSLLRYLDWSILPKSSIDIISIFLKCVKDTTTHESIRVPYTLGLIAVKTLLNVAITQYEQLEQTFESLQE
jgi:hypothetical protein